jgi:hypothetical protein
MAAMVPFGYRPGSPGLRNPRLWVRHFEMARVDTTALQQPFGVLGNTPALFG